VRNGQTIDCLDSRFSAAVVISAPPFYGEPDLAAVLRKVSVPTIHVTATDDVIEIPGYRSGVEDRLAIFDAIGSSHKQLAVFRGGSHSMFTDRPFTGGPSLNAKVKVATAELTSAFFDLAFEGDYAALTQWQTNWQPILARAGNRAGSSQANLK
jgi:pimeloyl-ACP methyl ester carboxylesterase